MNSKRLSLNQSLLAGSLSGLVSGLVFQPLEVLRTQSIGLKGQSSFEISRQIISKYGIPGFWRGTVASLARQMPGIAMFYGIVEFSSPKTPSQRLITGMSARSIATMIFLPLVVIKTKIEFGSQPNMAKSANFIYQTEGLRGFWKGLLPTLARDGPYSGIYLVLYRLMQERTGNSNQAISNFYIALAAGAMATIATQPADVLRCHLQIDHKLGFQNFKSHIDERGLIRTLYLDGLAPRITRRSLVSAINWTIFEEAKKYFNS